MYEIIKHAAKQTTTLFTSPRESMARTRFAKSARLLKPNETLELLHENKVIDSVTKSLPKDEDEQIMLPEAISTWSEVTATLYYSRGQHV
jgi:hypothetical protein